MSAKTYSDYMKHLELWGGDPFLEPILENYKNHADEPLTYDEHKHNLRIFLEDPVFDYLRSKYSAPLKEFWDTTSFPKMAPNTVMLVERRLHPNIEFVLHNFMYFTRNQNFSLTIVCSEDNEQFIRNILGKHLDSTNILVLFKDNCNRDKARSEYNVLFQDGEFWKKIDAEYILSIQTDSYLRKPLPEKLWNLDYVASPWAWLPQLVGGSGLTFRHRESIIDMCKRKLREPEGEDVFFAQMCRFLGKRVMDTEEGEHVFSESRFVDDPVGVHQWWSYLYQVADASEQKSLDKYRKIYTTLHI